MNRDERQDLSVDCVARNGGVGTIMGCTGYGKTRCGLKMLERIDAKIKAHTFIIVVHNIPVYEMWICITVYIHRHHNVIVYIRDVCRYVYALVVHVYLTMDK